MLKNIHKDSQAHPIPHPTSAPSQTLHMLLQGITRWRLPGPPFHVPSPTYRTTPTLWVWTEMYILYISPVFFIHLTSFYHFQALTQHGPHISLHQIALFISDTKLIKEVHILRYHPKTQQYERSRQ